jgi:hypothetical protein
MEPCVCDFSGDMCLVICTCMLPKCVWHPGLWSSSVPRGVLLRVGTKGFLTRVSGLRVNDTGYGTVFTGMMPGVTSGWINDPCVVV